MKVIDEKGMLFGKINIIDLFIVIFLIGLIPMCYSGYKILTHQPPGREDTAAVVKGDDDATQQAVAGESSTLGAAESIIITVKFRGLHPEVADMIRVGDRQAAFIPDDRITQAAEIVGIIANEPKEVAHWSPQRNRLVITEDPRYRDVTLEFDVMCVHTFEGLAVDKQAMRVGSGFGFFTSNYTLSGWRRGEILAIRNKRMP